MQASQQWLYTGAVLRPTRQVPGASEVRNASRRRLPDSRTASVFDVTNWLAGLSHCSPGEVRYVAERKQRGSVIVSYVCAGRPVRFRSHRLPASLRRPGS